MGLQVSVHTTPNFCKFPMKLFRAEAPGVHLLNSIVERLGGTSLSMLTQRHLKLIIVEHLPAGITAL